MDSVPARPSCDTLRTVSGNTSNPDRFQAALALFDQHNAADPNVERVGGAVNGNVQPRELVHARWLTDWVLKLAPQASEELRLAARCQHLCRWEIPRSSYPMTRAGYLQWRNALKAFHAQKSGEILRQVGYPDDTIVRVQNLNLKKNFPSDSDSRVLEDALCLVFLEHQFAELAHKTAEDKMIGVLRKTWQKMTPAAHEHALKLSYDAKEKALLDKALAPAS
jgi:hypothetical protein